MSVQCVGGLCQEIKDEKSEKEKSNLEKVEQAAKASAPAKGGKPEKGTHQHTGKLSSFASCRPSTCNCSFFAAA